MGQTVDTRVLKKFKHEVMICSAQDAIVDGKLIMSQKLIYKGWAMINPRRAQTFSREGHTILEEKDRRTHFIHMRYNPMVEITVGAWIYEHRLISPPRWFKILFVMDEYDDSRYFKFDCRLMQVGDHVIEPETESQLGVPAGMEY